MELIRINQFDDNHNIVSARILTEDDEREFLRWLLDNYPEDTYDKLLSWHILKNEQEQIKTNNRR